MLNNLRKRLQGEEGFTLIELLVVILIIGILAAIAIPSFLNQKGKGEDTAAKSAARSTETALETYYTDNSTYACGASCDTALHGIESTLAPFGTSAGNVNVTDTGNTGTPGPSSYRITAYSKPSGRAFWIDKTAGGVVSRGCSPVGQGSCNTGSW